ncbi:MAG: tyrosine-protein phosphatase [Candidatus Omnitrophica bacterium]|nr:tyrosine-protein phosphatase [Candidatus Omnitrophota bacterium]MBU4479807.1 tyrosine-protein phosphatase [Candidatus Omnitrophota bacterium]
MKKLVITLLSGLLFFTGCAYLGLTGGTSDLPNFHPVDIRLYRGAAPSPQGFEQLRSRGIKTIISFKNNEEHSPEEKDISAGLGMKFHHLPLSLYEKPADETVLKFLEIVLNKDNRPVFLYCANGKDRTGAMIAMYRVVACGLTIKQGYKEAKKYGFWPYYGNTPELKDFIHQLKDKTIYFEKARELLNEKNN